MFWPIAHVVGQNTAGSASQTSYLMYCVETVEISTNHHLVSGRCLATSWPSDTRRFLLQAGCPFHLTYFRGTWFEVAGIAGTSNRNAIPQFRFRPSLLQFGTTANITWLPPVWNKQILSRAAPLYMHNLHSSSPSERENYLSYCCFCLLKCVEVGFHITDWGEVVDFDLGMRLGENACEMLNNDRTSEQVKVLQKEWWHKSLWSESYCEYLRHACAQKSRFWGRTAEENKMEVAKSSDHEEQVTSGVLVPANCDEIERKVLWIQRRRAYNK